MLDRRGGSLLSLAASIPLHACCQMASRIGSSSGHAGWWRKLREISQPQQSTHTQTGDELKQNNQPCGAHLMSDEPLQARPAAAAVQLCNRSSMHARPAAASCLAAPDSGGRACCPGRLSIAEDTVSVRYSGVKACRSLGRAGLVLVSRGEQGMQCRDGS